MQRKQISKIIASASSDGSNGAICMDGFSFRYADRNTLHNACDYNGAALWAANGVIVRSAAASIRATAY